MYECLCCEFSTLNKKDYNRHLSTIKHKKNINSNTVCKFCFKTYSNVSNKNKHEKNVALKIVLK